MAVAALSAELARIDEKAIDREWFASEEALAVFRLLSEKASFEPQAAKVETLGRVVAVCGTNDHSRDPMKLSVIDHLARLSAVQIRLLSVIAQIQPTERTFTANALTQRATAVWLGDIRAKLEGAPPFWSGTLMLNEELEVLESHNTVRRTQLMVASGEQGFLLTGIGQRAAAYLRADQ